MEEDYGVKLYSTFYRQYDPQIGRFGGVDILSERIAGMSAYQFSNNNPISYNYPTGALFTIGDLTANRNEAWGAQGDDFGGFSSADFAGYGGGGGGGDGGSEGNVRPVDGGYKFSGVAAESFTQDLQYAYNHRDENDNWGINIEQDNDGNIVTQSSFSSTEDEGDNGNGYRQETISFHRTQYAYLAIDKASIQGIYHIDGTMLPNVIANSRARIRFCFIGFQYFYKMLGYSKLVLQM
ncbi:MAG: RHS repeat-associated core domain-containing protein [Ginsengibacter sp.]